MTDDADEFAEHLASGIENSRVMVFTRGGSTVAKIYFGLLIAWTVLLGLNALNGYWIFAFLSAVFIVYYLIWFDRNVLVIVPPYTKEEAISNLQKFVGGGR